jgi:hypothetical protein
MELKMKFRYYITDLFGNHVSSTNDFSIAMAYFASANYFVVDSDSGKWMSENEEIEIEEG